MSANRATLGCRWGERSRAVRLAFWLSLVGGGGGTQPGMAGTLNVPNASFESPVTSFVNINVDAWQKSPKPAWYVESGGILWSQLVGAFKNTAAGNADHIDNCDGNQALWLFAVPEVAAFQDYDSMDWNDPAPTHAFAATFEVGRSYHLTVGVIGTGGNMQPGVTLALSLYHRVGTNRVPVATTVLTNAPEVFSNNTHFVDCEVNVPVVKSGDPWAGQRIGIEFRSLVSQELQGGYWDLDNVRLIAGPVLLRPALTNGQFEFTLRGEPGARFEILAGDDLASAPSNWTSVRTLTNATGRTTFDETAATAAGRFFQARQLP